MVPVIVQINKEGRTERDLFSYEFEKKRVIRLTGEINSTLADCVLAKLDYLNSVSNEDISMYVNSVGGSVSDGLAIVDAMKRSKSDIRVIVTGIAASMGAFIVAVGGSRGKRSITPNSEMMIHQPLGGIQGQASDVELAAIHMTQVKKKLIQMLAEATGKDIAQISRDTDRDNFMDAKTSVDYGLVDRIEE